MSKISLIVLLGQRLTKDKKMNPRYREITAVALTLLRNGYGLRAIFCGGVTRPGCKSEAQTARDEMADTGDLEKIILEANSRTTFQNMKNLRKLFLKHWGRRFDTQIGSVIFVTTDAHKPRAQLLADRILPELADKIRFYTIQSDPEECAVHERLMPITRHDRYGIFDFWYGLIARNGLFSFD